MYNKTYFSVPQICGSSDVIIIVVILFYFRQEFIISVPAVSALKLRGTTMKFPTVDRFLIMELQQFTHSMKICVLSIYVSKPDA